MCGDDPPEYSKLITRLLDDLERAFEALYGKERDT